MANFATSFAGVNDVAVCHRYQRQPAANLPPACVSCVSSNGKWMRGSNKSWTYSIVTVLGGKGAELCLRLNNQVQYFFTGKKSKKSTLEWSLFVLCWPPPPSLPARCPFSGGWPEDPASFSHYVLQPRDFQPRYGPHPSPHYDPLPVYHDQTFLWAPPLCCTLRYLLALRLSPLLARPLPFLLAHLLACPFPPPLVCFPTRPLVHGLACPLARPLACPLARPLTCHLPCPLACPLARPLARLLARPLTCPLARPLAPLLARPLARPLACPLSCLLLLFRHVSGLLPQNLQLSKLILWFIYCTCTATKIPLIYSFSGNSAASAPISTFMCLWAHLYIPRISLLISSSRTGRPIVEIYNSLTDTWMWKLGLRPRYSFSGNICFEISVFCLAVCICTHFAII